MSATRTVAVTGASGFIGGALCRTLAARGWEVRALVRQPERFAGLPGARTFRCDLPDSIDEGALAGAGAVVHCAYATRETDLDRARRVNEDGTHALLEWVVTVVAVMTGTLAYVFDWIRLVRFRSRAGQIALR